MQTNVQLDSNTAHHIKRDHATIEVSISCLPYSVMNVMFFQLFEIELRPYR